MHEPFFTTEADEMSRAFDPTNTDAAAVNGIDAGADNGLDATAVETSPPPRNGKSAGAVPLKRAAATQHSVCPFCGTINEAAAAACRQCGMENSQATRTATRSKIGPWFVWQARNPAAPGMNWATLTALVEKGRVTPRSVVRGPTTGQLWRFAARVKGLSREFGLCWHCGGELQKAARLCGACKRLQQPPANPDVLLETADSTQPTQRPALRDPKTGGLLSLMPEAIRKEVAPAAPVVAAPVAKAPAPRHVPTPDEITNDVAPPGRIPYTDPTEGGNLPVIDMGDDAMPSGVEMRAFQFPHDYARGAAPRHSVLKRILIAAALALLAAAVGGYFTPQVRPHYDRLFQSIMSRVTGPNGHRLPSNATPPAPTTPAYNPATDPWMNTPLAPATPKPSPTPLIGVTDTPPRPAGTSIDVSGAPTSRAKSPAKPDINVRVSPPHDEASSSASKPGPASDPTAAANAEIQITAPPTTPADAEKRAWELYGRAVKSEQRGDYAAAVKEYEWIAQLRLPDGYGPLDVDARLQRAKQLAQQKN